MALIEATAAAVGTTASYFPQQAITLFSQSVELFVLLSDTIGVTLLGAATGATCGLFHHLPEIVSKNGDTIV
jgi:hypothetical protein